MTLTTAALTQIARAGGGSVEGYPNDVANRPYSSRFLFNGTAAMFERLGFARLRPPGKTRWVMAKTHGP